MQYLTRNIPAIFAAIVLSFCGLSFLSWSHAGASSIGIKPSVELTPAGNRRPLAALFPTALRQASPDPAIIYSSRLMQGRDGAYYGVGTSIAGANGSETQSQSGVVFRLSSTGQPTILHSFSSKDGASPSGAVVESGDGFLYGVTSEGGVYDEGTIYRIKTDGTGFTVLHSLKGKADGSYPHAGLVQDMTGNLYGVASQGGKQDRGTVFQITPAGVFKLLHSLGDADGTDPQAGLLLSQDGILFGTTRGGGPNNNGTVFKIATDGSGFQTVHVFDGERGAARKMRAVPGALPVAVAAGLPGVLSGHDGARPESELIDGGDGLLYGTTALGGEKNEGVIFRIARDGSGFQILHRFNSGVPGVKDGIQPLSLIAAPDGFLYGTTLFGGVYNRGIVYRVTRNGSGYGILDSFANDGDDPHAGLILAPDGHVCLPSNKQHWGGDTELSPLQSGSQSMEEKHNDPHPSKGQVSPQSTWTVTDTSDSPTDAGSLRYAIDNAGSGDTINFSLTGCPCTIQLTTGSLNITQPLTVNGPGSTQLTISGGIINIDHGDGKGAEPTPTRVFFIASNGVTIGGLTVTNGIGQGGVGGCGAAGGGGGAGLGGGMFIYDPNRDGYSITLKDIAFVSNQAIGGNGGTGNSCMATSGGAGGGFGYIDGAGFREQADTDGNGGYGAGGGLNGNGGTLSNGQLSGVGGTGGSRGEDSFTDAGGGQGGGSSQSGGHDQWFGCRVSHSVAERCAAGRLLSPGDA